jgi:hypothetical protein
MDVKLAAALGFIALTGYAMSVKNEEAQSLPESDEDWGDYEEEDGQEEGEEIEDQIEGGIGDETDPEDLDPEEYHAGEEVEMEHTNDPTIAREIARDHLTEDPRYYTHLKEMEERGRASR